MMPSLFRSWSFRLLLAGCCPAATIGFAGADDEQSPSSKPEASATADDAGDTAAPAGPARGRFREAMQDRVRDFQNGAGGMRPDPDRVVAMLMEKFDEDKDQKLSADELKKALGALRNMGGMLGGPGAGGMAPGGSGGQGPGPMGPEFVSRLFEMNDKDDDGKLSGDEIPERMRQVMDRVDRNGDGAVDRAEAEEMAAKMSGGQRPGGGREGNTPTESRVPRRPPSE